MNTQKYTTLLFDADNTLLDFFAAEERAIEITCKHFNIPFSKEIGKLYSDINDSFWKRFEKGEIKREEINCGRFKQFAQVMGSDANPQDLADFYIEELSNGNMIIEGADRLCEALSKKYDMYIVTNGHASVQKRRFGTSSLPQYFKKSFISEEMGSKKPEKEYFDLVFKELPEKDKSKICIIGDSMSSDILGGINAGIDTCFYNRFGLPKTYEPTYEVKNFDELLDLFE